MQRVDAPKKLVISCIYIVATWSLGSDKVYSAAKAILLFCIFSFNDHYFQALKSEFRHRSRDGGPAKANGKNISEIVSNIVWVKQLEAKVFVIFGAYETC